MDVARVDSTTGLCASHQKCRREKVPTPPVAPRSSADSGTATDRHINRRREDQPGDASQTAAPPPSTGPTTGPIDQTAPVADNRQRADQNVVSIVQVFKSFGDVPALRSLTLCVPQSRITVLLGPNGAGKTTAIRLITGALTADAGQVAIFGLDPTGSDGEHIRRRCGVVSAKPSLYDRLSGYDNLQYAAQLYGLESKVMDARIRDSAAQFGIDDALAQRVGGYSTGMKTRLALARATLHDPDLLLLDEPTSGLDPESAQAVLAMVREMTANDKSVLMCTHLLSEAEGLADEVVVIDAGSDLETGPQHVLTDRYWPGKTVDVTVNHPSAVAVIEGAVGVKSAEASGDIIRVQIDDLDLVPALVERLVGEGLAVRSVVPKQPTLEDLYFAIRRRHRANKTLNPQADDHGVSP